MRFSTNVVTTNYRCRKVESNKEKRIDFGKFLFLGVLVNNRLRCFAHGACFRVDTGDIEEHPGHGHLPSKSKQIRKQGKNHFLENFSFSVQRRSCRWTSCSRRSKIWPRETWTNQHSRWFAGRIETGRSDRWRWRRFLYCFFLRPVWKSGFERATDRIVSTIRRAMKNRFEKKPHSDEKNFYDLFAEKENNTSRSSTEIVYDVKIWLEREIEFNERKAFENWSITGSSKILYLLSLFSRFHLRRHVETKRISGPNCSLHEWKLVALRSSLFQKFAKTNSEKQKYFYFPSENSKVQLSKNPSKKPQDLILRDQNYLRRAKVDLMLETLVTNINWTGKSLTYQTIGKQLKSEQYDFLVLATGLRSRTLPKSIIGHDLRNIFYLRSMDDASKLVSKSETVWRWPQ